MCAEIGISATLLDEVVLQDYGMNERGYHVVIVHGLRQVLNEEIGVSHVCEGLHLRIVETSVG